MAVAFTKLVLATTALLPACGGLCSAGLSTNNPHKGRHSNVGVRVLSVAHPHCSSVPPMGTSFVEGFDSNHGEERSAGLGLQKRRLRGRPWLLAQLFAAPGVETSAGSGEFVHSNSLPENEVPLAWLCRLCDIGTRSRAIGARSQVVSKFRSVTASEICSAKCTPHQAKEWQQRGKSFSIASEVHVRQLNGPNGDGAHYDLTGPFAHLSTAVQLQFTNQPTHSSRLAGNC
eukprot:3657744-Amphidinium_carterae.2